MPSTSMRLAAFSAMMMLVTSCAEKSPESADVTGEAPPAVSRDVDALRSDYLVACRAIADGYVCLEEKTGLSPDAFYAAGLVRAEAIGANGGDSAAKDFITAIRELRSRFADGHFGWSLGRELGREASMTLGMTTTMRGDELVVAAVRWSDAEKGDRPSVGDAIVAVDGEPAIRAVEELGKLIPQSTRRSTMEFAARYIGFEPAWMPLRDSLPDASIEYRRKDGSTATAVLRWESGRSSLTRNAVPSLEEMPDGATELSGELFYYTLTVSGERYAVVHPRAFLDWSGSDMDAVIRKAERDGADALVVDLKDSAGGAFDQVMILLRALGVDDPLAFTMRTRDAASGAVVEERGDFSALGREAAGTEAWNGRVIVRTNPIAGSACDFFAFAMKRAGRAAIIGEATAGRGCGTDTLTLPRSGTEIDIPRRDRILDGPGGRIEGTGVEPDFTGEGTLPELLSGFAAGAK